MVSEAPPFWWRKEGSWIAGGLVPFSWVYGWAAGRRLERGRRARVAAPVLCIGNFTVGGAGKTPTAIALVDAARKAGLKPGLLSRGYGGTLEGPVLVDAGHHRARDVGDEPMLLARAAPTVIARDRLKGARLLLETGVDLIVMDDGFQSAQLDCDHALMVIDAERGLGNGRIIPAGPVRAPLAGQIRHASALLVVGEGEAADEVIRLAARAGKPVHTARIRPRDAARFEGARVLAYAGIGDPDRFFRSLRACGADIVTERRFGDHHTFLEDEMRDLIAEAKRDRLQLVATEKDLARHAGLAGTAEDLLEKSLAFAIGMEFDEPATPGRIVEKTVAAFREKQLAAPSAAGL